MVGKEERGGPMLLSGVEQGTWVMQTEKLKIETIGSTYIVANLWIGDGT